MHLMHVAPLFVAAEDAAKPVFWGIPKEMVMVSVNLWRKYEEKIYI